MQITWATTGQKLTTTVQGRWAVEAAAEKLRLKFSLREAWRLTGLSYWTLKWWAKRGYISKTLSAWELMALAILSATNRGKGTGANYGDVLVKRTMSTVSDLDDVLLLSEEQQGPYIAEAAAAISNAALPSGELQMTEEDMERLARVVAAIDRKARTSHRRPR